MDALKIISTKSEFNLIMNSLEPSANCKESEFTIKLCNNSELPHLIRKINYKINQQKYIKIYKINISWFQGCASDYISVCLMISWLLVCEFFS